MPNRECPVCGTKTDASTCCGIHLGGVFVMSKARIRSLRAYAHGTKGLDADTYRLHVSAVGARSTVDLTWPQYNELLKRLAKLPDATARAHG